MSSRASTSRIRRQPIYPSFPDFPQFSGYGIQRFIPGYALPLTLASSPDPAQGVLEAVGGVEDLQTRQAFLTDTGVAVIREGSRLQLGYLAVPNMGQDAALTATVGGTSRTYNELF